MLDYSEMQRKYGGEFIAVLNEFKVVAHAKTFNEVVDKLKKSGNARDLGTSIRIQHIQSRRGAENTA